MISNENILLSILVGIIVSLLAWHYKQSFTLRDKEDTVRHKEVHNMQEQVTNLATSFLLIQKDVAQTLEYQKMILEVMRNVDAVKLKVEAFKDLLEGHNKRIDTLEKYSIQYDKDISEIKNNCTRCKGKE